MGRLGFASRLYGIGFNGQLPVREKLYKVLSLNNDAGDSTMLKLKLFSTAIIATNLIFANTAFAQDETANVRLEHMKMEIDNYSRKNQVTDDESEKRLKIMQNLPFIASEISNAVGDDLSGVWFQNRNFFRLNVRLTKHNKIGQLPKTLYVPVDNGANVLPLDVNYIPGSAQNREGIEQALSDNAEMVASTIPEFSGFHYDPMEDEFVISTALSKRGEVGKLRSDKRYKSISGVKTRIVGDVPVPQLMNIFGGDPLADFGGTFCTVGFTAVRNGLKGIVTAEHCTPRIDSQYTTITPNNSRNHDMEFRQLNNQATVIRPLFQENGFFRFVTSIGNTNSLNLGGGLLAWFNPGTQLCHFGQTTGFSCGEVQTVTANGYCVAGGNTFGACNNVFITVKDNDLRVNFGDSGGPVFNGGIAHGIVSAMNADIFGIKTMYVSRIEFVNSELGATIITGP